MLRLIGLSRNPCPFVAPVHTKSFGIEVTEDLTGCTANDKKIWIFVCLFDKTKNKENNAVE
jgi:hypothetical protein